MLAAELTLSTLLTDVGSVFTSFIGYVSSICEAIAGAPLLLLGFCVPFVFAIVSLVKRLFQFEKGDLYYEKSFIIFCHCIIFFLFI